MAKERSCLSKGRQVDVIIVEELLRMLLEDFHDSGTKLDSFLCVAGVDYCERVGELRAVPAAIRATFVLPYCELDEYWKFKIDGVVVNENVQITRAGFVSLRRPIIVIVVRVDEFECSVEDLLSYSAQVEGVIAVSLNIVSAQPRPSSSDNEVLTSLASFRALANAAQRLPMIAECACQNWPSG